MASAWTITYRLLWGVQHLNLIVIFYLVVTGMLLYSLMAATKGQSFAHLPPATGRVVAIVPAYNEDPQLLSDAVWALINQSRPPEEIHVVDDGSKVPVEPFDHPLVTWHRQVNKGKREAQAFVLRKLDRDGFDFLLTVDSDSVLEINALRNALRALSDPRVQAATGLLLVRNRQKVLGKILDLEMVTWSLVMRTARSLLGAIAPTSGALAVYRKDLVYDNLDDYVASGTAGDDRRLTHYALARGRAVAVNDAIVYTDMPETAKGVFVQRTRWFKSYWLYTLWEIGHIRGIPFFFRMYGLVMTFIMPVIYLWLIFVATHVMVETLLLGMGYWVILTYSMTGMYAIMRPEMSLRNRLAVWLLLTPLMALMNLLLVKPALYWALTKVKNTSWQTREVPPLVPALGTINE